MIGENSSESNILILCFVQKRIIETTFNHDDGYRFCRSVITLLCKDILRKMKNKRPKFWNSDKNKFNWQIFMKNRKSSIKMDETRTRNDPDECRTANHAICSQAMISWSVFLIIIPIRPALSSRSASQSESPRPRSAPCTSDRLRRCQESPLPLKLGISIRIA